MREEIRKIQGSMEGAHYVTDPAIATAVYLAMTLQKPLLVEGHAGVGKTEIAKVLARVLDTNLIRLQCYEGLDAGTALYEWNYPKQLLRIKLEEREERSVEAKEADIFSAPFLLRRPLLQAITQEGRAPVLLVDEIDRADLEFESFLLEVLSDFQVTIPELGTVKAAETPIVIITSNRTREIHDALKRRCFYHWIDYPDLKRELEILKVKAPGAAEALSGEVVAFVQKLRATDLFKLPGVAETIDWTQALMQLDVLSLTPEAVNDTLGVLLKYQDDIAKMQGGRVAELIEEARAAIRG